MKKPYMICHMMMSIDGRIDCGMTVKIAGSNEYYETLNALNVPTTLIGRVKRGLLKEEGCSGLSSRCRYKGDAPLA